VVVDSGVWIDHFTGRGGAAAGILASALRNGEEVLLLPVIVQEILQGTRDAGQFRRYSSLLKPIPLARIPRPRQVAVAAADLYARLRWRGRTVPPIDCWIAACAMAARWPLLTADGDFLQIARIEPRFRVLLPGRRTGS